MKKVLSLMIISLVAILPFVVKADTEIGYSCGEADANGIISCTMNYKITGDLVEQMTVTLTEQGGAEIQEVTAAIDSQWMLTPASESNGVWTVILASPGVADEGDLFAFSYKVSGEKDCKILVSLNGVEKATIAPADEPTENKDTGSTLPYIALGSIALIAAGAYVATRNKSKVYKI